MLNLKIYLSNKVKILLCFKIINFQPIIPIDKNLNLKKYLEILNKIP
jgi:hypothetical protein